MPQTLTFLEMFQRADWASMSVPFILQNGGVYGYVILFIGGISVLAFMGRLVRATPGGGGLFLILGIIALIIGAAGSMAGLSMANEVIQSTKGAADPTQVDHAYTAAAVTTVLGGAVLVANLIFLLFAALRGGSRARETSSS